MNLSNLGVKELNVKEIQQTQGGFLHLVGLALLAMAIHDAIDYPEAFIAGFTGEKMK